MSGHYSHNKMSKRPTIIIDTREQRPFSFKGMCTVRRKLEVGDYSVRGLTQHVAVERKSKADLFSTMGNAKNRFRFTRELDLSSTLGMSVYIVVEAPLSHVFMGCKYSKINPIRMVESLLTMCVKWRLQIHFVENRLVAERLTKAILMAHWKEAGA